MKQELINIMKSDKRLRLSFGQTLTHYGIVLFMLFIVVLSGKSIIEIYLLHTYSGTESTEELILNSLPFLGLAITFSIIQYRRLRFREINISYTDHQFQEAIKRTTSDLGWKIENNNKDLFKAYRPWSGGSYGEMITIIKEKDGLLINSICDPNSMSSIASFGWNKRNVNFFLRNLNETIQNITASQKVEEVISKKEWTLKKILIRLFAYPFCLFLIFFGVYMILKPLTIRTIIAGVGAIVAATFYLYSDLKIIVTNSANKKSPNR
jgi:uncharacterized membrane protein YcjF (UPF0283 family)